MKANAATFAWLLVAVVGLQGCETPVAQKRSAKTVVLFKAQNPCPLTESRSGPCAGYVVDHIKPLACGGADDVSNMQWQTVAAAKEKDKWERKGCTVPRTTNKFVDTLQNNL